MGHASTVGGIVVVNKSESTRKQPVRGRPDQHTLILVAHREHGHGDGCTVTPVITIDSGLQLVDAREHLIRC